MSYISWLNALRLADPLPVFSKILETQPLFIKGHLLLTIKVKG